MEPPKERTPDRHSPRSSVIGRRAEYDRLGAWIRKQREAAGLQQKPVSRALGKPDQFLNKVEQGRQRIDVIEFSELLVQLRVDLSISMGELLSALFHSPKDS